MTHNDSLKNLKTKFQKSFPVIFPVPQFPVALNRWKTVPLFRSSASHTARDHEETTPWYSRVSVGFAIILTYFHSTDPKNTCRLLRMKGHKGNRLPLTLRFALLSPLARQLQQRYHNPGLLDPKMVPTATISMLQQSLKKRKKSSQIIINKCVTYNLAKPFSLSILCVLKLRVLQEKFCVNACLLWEEKPIL